MIAKQHRDLQLTEAVCKMEAALPVTDPELSPLFHILTHVPDTI